MALVIKNAPPASPALPPVPTSAPEKATKAAHRSGPAPDMPRKGVHLRASPWERRTATNYSGVASAPLCTAPDTEEATYLARKVTCPCCIAWIVDRLELPEYLTLQQWAIIGRDPLPGAPDADKGEQYPKDLPPARDEARGRLYAMDRRVKKSEPVVIPKSMQSPPPPPAKPSVYDDF